MADDENRPMFGARAARADHMATCKARALEYVEIGDLAQAVASMSSDLRKHPDTADVGRAMAGIGLFEAMSGSPDAVRRWIEGFA